MAKSYYAILGISKRASADEIRSAYRRLAKEFHPDHYAGSNDIFREVQEAYSILGNTGRKKEYDWQTQERHESVPIRHAQKPEPEPLIPDEKPVDMGSISPARSFQTFTPSYDEIFNWLWKNFSNLSRPKSGRVRNLTLEVTLTPEQARQGGTARVMVPAQAICPTCRGYGSIGLYECMRCAGEGRITGELPVSIAFPAGITRDHAVLVSLDRFGIRNIHLTVLFRPTEED
jgi:DnaJ-class molecular chaperone